MNELIQSVIDFVKGLWPFDKVHQWEAGLLVKNGRVVKVLGPGVYFILWWFWELHVVSIQPALVGTGRQDITLKDGSVVTYAASARAQVVDPEKAYGVDNYKETTQEALTAVISDKLADVDPARLEPSARGRLLSDLTRWAAKEVEEYGIELRSARFSSFVHRAKTIRLITDTGSSSVSTW